jgi:hypothetical protein
MGTVAGLKHLDHIHCRWGSFVVKSIVLHKQLVEGWLYTGTDACSCVVAGITMFKNLPRQTFGKLQVCEQLRQLNGVFCRSKHRISRHAFP